MLEQSSPKFRPSPRSFPIVGIGASAGGLDAFMQLLEGLPTDTGMGLVLVQHLDPERPSALTGLLAAKTRLPVSEALNGQAVEPNHVYVIPPNAEMTLIGGVLKLRPRVPGLHHPVDTFLKSLAEDRKTHSIGVILSGTDTDGTLGLEAIKGEGGITFAQDEKSAKFDGMPRSATESGCVDFVMEPREIARQLGRLSRHQSVSSPVVERSEAANEEVQSTSEEAQSAKEEPQSANEELETSKEKPQASNEELATSNEELQNRNREVSGLNNDLTNLLANASIPIVMLGEDLCIRCVSLAAEKILNLNTSDVGRSISDVKLKVGIPELEQLIHTVIESTSPVDREVQDRQGRWHQLRLRPYKTQENKIEGAVMALVDIDTLKKNEQELAQARDYAEATLRAAPYPLLVLEADLRVKTANQAFYKCFKMRSSETEGKFIYELGDRQWDVPQLRQLLEDILPRKSFFEGFEMTQEFKSLGTRTIMLGARRTNSLGGNILLGIIDITERIQTENELRAVTGQLSNQAAHLERLVGERTRALWELVGEMEAFSYSLAHDMRTPLQGMRGLAQIVLEEYRDKLDAKGANYLENIVGSGARLDRLIQDVLKYTGIVRAEAGLSPVSLDRLVREIVADSPDWRAPVAEIEIIGTLPSVMGHEGFLTQCIFNLLGNAVKFVAPGVKPRIKIWAEEIESRVRLWVEDNGIGIEPRNQDRIFRLFERVQAATEYEGTGIGLTITRKAVERMGGRVGLESQPGAGSRFWIELMKQSDV